MNIDLLKLASEENENCRIKSVRDLFLLYGYKINYEILYLLSLSNFSFAGSIDYKNINIPAITPVDFNCDINILDSLGIKYEILKPDMNDRDWVDAKLLNGTPVLCLFSKMTFLSKLSQNNIIEFVTSMVIYNRKDELYCSNFTEKDKFTFDELWNARTIESLPFPSKAKIICLDEETNLGDRLNNINIINTVHRNLRTSITNYLNKTSDENKAINYYSGIDCYVYFATLLDDFKKLIISIDDFHIAKRIFLVFNSVLLRFMRVTSKYDCFDRENLIKSLQYLANETNDYNIGSWCKSCKKMSKTWNRVVIFILYNNTYTISLQRMTTYCDMLTELILNAYTEELKKINNLADILL